MEMLYPAVGAAALATLLGGALLGVALRRRGRRKAAQLRLQWGDLKGAARLFEEAREFDRAAGLYAEAGERLQALALQLKLGNVDAAIEALRGASAAELDEASSRLQEAGALEDRTRASALARIARTAGHAGLAARMFEQAGNNEEARTSRLQEARSLAASGRPLEAAALFERLGDRRAAAAALVDAARKEGDAALRADHARKAAATLQQMADLQGAADALAVGGDIDAGARLLLDAGNLAGAAQLLQWHGRMDKAAQLFEQAGDFKGASRAWNRAGDIARAAAMLERAGDPVGAARLLLDAHNPQAAAQVHVRAGSRSAAAEILAGAGDVDGAVKVYLDGGELDNAVELLCKRNRARDAAALLQAHGEAHRASILLAEAGDLSHKAQVLIAQGDLAGAAQAFMDLGQPHEARKVLARAPRLEPLGRFLLARACMAASDFGEAAQHFAALIDAPPPGLKRVDVVYGLARAFESMGRVREALASLHEVLSLDPSYRDVSFRIRLLEARAEAPARSTTPTVAGRPSAGGADLPAEWSGGAQAAAHTGVPPRYNVEKELGRGAMGVVYRAVDSQLGRTVAIKVLDHKAGADPRIREYFLREARAVALLVHPNIVTLFDAGLEGASPYLVMELVEGCDLRDRLQQGPLPVRDALYLVAAIASALDYAHQRKIVHRDVKPENILVGQDGTPKLMDFGVAHMVQDGAGPRRATVIGTPVYMAPEQIKGEPVAGYTDLYALGGVLYECLVGQPPFDPNGAMYHHINTAPPDPRAWRPELSEELVAWISSCLSKDPAGRPANGRQLAEALLALAQTLAA